MKKRTYPWFPITALIFFIGMYLLAFLNIIPSPTELLNAYEQFFISKGYLGLFTIVALEGLVYLGIYSPGSSLLVYSVLYSKTLPIPFLLISITAALALTFTAIINYSLGRIIGNKHTIIQQPFFDKKLSKKGLFWSCLHPNILAFYFFNEGMGQKPLKRLWHLPIIATGVGFFYTLIFYLFSSLIGYRLERIPIMLLILIIWLTIRWREENK